MPPTPANGRAKGNVASKLTESHLLVDGEMSPGEEVSIRVAQVLMHDATGPLIALELEAMGLDEIRPELAVGYVDHLLIQGDSKNADDHLFLRSACQRFGMWYSKPGNGISHPVHQERAKEAREEGGRAVVGGRNYDQGSSREHAALAPRYLELRLENRTKDTELTLRHVLSKRQIDVMLEGGLINRMRAPGRVKEMTMNGSTETMKTRRLWWRI